MSAQVLKQYEEATEHLAAELKFQFPGIAVHIAAACVPIYPHYNQRDPKVVPHEAEVAMLVVTDRAKTGTLAIVPVALYEQGEILASAALTGSLADRLRGVVLETLAIRDGRWVFLGVKPLPTRRFPTMDLGPVLASVL